MNYFKDINLNSNGCIEPAIKDNTYTLNNHIGLYKQIGSVSRFGVVYKCGNINKNYSSLIPKFVTKIQLQTEIFKSELKILLLIMKLTSKNNNSMYSINL